MGTQVNACLPALLLNVSPLKSQMTLDSFFPVFIFRLARPICSHLRGNVRELFLFLFVDFALKVSAKGKPDLPLLNVFSQPFV